MDERMKKKASFLETSFLLGQLDEKAGVKFALKGMNEIYQTLDRAVLKMYDETDRPALIAVLENAAQNLRKTINDSGNELADTFVEALKAMVVMIAVDKTELRKQRDKMGGVDPFKTNDGSTKPQGDTIDGGIKRSGGGSDDDV